MCTKFRRFSVIDLTVSQLVHAKTYIGYDISTWDFRSSAYLLGIRNKTYVHNLNYTLINLRRALSVLLSIMVRKGQCALINESLASSLTNLFDFK